MRCDTVASMARKPLLQELLQKQSVLGGLVDVLHASHDVGGHGMQQKLAVVRSVELMKFLYLKAMRGDVDGTLLSPSPELDEAWHALMLRPSLYKNVCDTTGMLDHMPVHDVDERERRRLRTWEAVVEAFPTWASDDAMATWHALRPTTLPASVLSTASTLTITLNTLYGVVRKVAVPSTATVETLMKQLEAVELGDRSYKLVYNGNIISKTPEALLWTLDMRDGANVYAVLILSGC